MIPTRTAYYARYASDSQREVEGQRPGRENLDGQTKPIGGTVCPGFPMCGSASAVRCRPVTQIPTNQGSARAPGVLSNLRILLIDAC